MIPLLLLLIVSFATHWIDRNLSFTQEATNAFFPLYTPRTLLQDGGLILSLLSWVLLAFWSRSSSLDSIFRQCFAFFAASFLLLSAGSLVYPPTFFYLQGLSSLFSFLAPFLVWSFLDHCTPLNHADKRFPLYGLLWVCSTILLTFLGLLWLRWGLFPLSPDHPWFLALFSLLLSSLSGIIFFLSHRVPPYEKSESSEEIDLWLLIGGMAFLYATVFILFGWFLHKGPLDLLASEVKKLSCIRLFIEHSLLKEIGAFFLLLYFCFKGLSLSSAKRLTCLLAFSLILAGVDFLAPFLSSGSFLLPFFFLNFLAVWTTSFGLSIFLTVRHRLYAAIPQEQRFRQMVGLEWGLFFLGSRGLRDLNNSETIPSPLFLWALLIAGAACIYLSQKQFLKATELFQRKI